MRKLTSYVPPVDHPGAQLTCPVVSDDVGTMRRATEIIPQSLPQLALDVSAADEQDPRLGAGDSERVWPGKIRENGLGLMKLRGADQQGEAARGSDQAGSDRKDVGEALYGTEGYEVEGRLGREGFGTVGVHIDVCQYKRAGYFAKEGGFFLIRFDQGERDARGPELDGESGQAGTGAQVSDARPGKVFCPGGRRGFAQGSHRGSTGEQVAGSEQAFAEVAGDDFFRVADGSKVNARIPAHEYIDVCRYGLQLEWGEQSRLLAGLRRFGMTKFGRDYGLGGDSEERLEQLGDAGLVHWKRDCRGRGRRCEEVILREIWLEGTQLGSKTASERLLTDILVSAARIDLPDAEGWCR